MAWLSSYLLGGACAVRRVLPTMVLFAGSLLAACDTEPPEYFVPSIFLRFIPERSSIGPDGGSVFALLELSAPARSGSQPLVVAVRGIDASVDTLPGAVRCTPSSETDGGASASTRSGDVLLPDAAFKSGRDGGLLETGILVRVPKGTGDALLEAAVYEVDEMDICAIGLTSRLIALTNLRITRELPVMSDAGPESEADDAGSEAESAGAR